MAFVASAGPLVVRGPCSWFIVHRGGLVVRRAASGVALPDDDDVARLGIDVAAAHVLGRLDDSDALAAPYDGALEALAPPLEVLGLRALAAILDAETFGVAGRALHVIDWASTSRFCGRCGAATALLPGQRCMKCPRCGLEVYPRIAPAIIVLVRRGDEALLARNARFPGTMFSTLAGFSEIGESLEQTLLREVHEEVGVRVRDPRYFGSQPWPFPHSLMIGFRAEWESGDIAVDATEISEARWFRADALPQIPPPLSIARKLIDAWVREVRDRG